MEYFRPIWNCFSAFCNCLRCSDELASQGYEPSERTHLLADPVNSSPALRCPHSDNLSNDYSQSLPKKDEQNALSRLVQNTAINMIDVGAMDSHNLEHQEYNDRIKLYSQRLQQQWSNIHHPGTIPSGLLKDVPNSEYYLITLPMKTDDLSQIKNLLHKCQSALNDIKIDHKEAIVVPFRIP